MPGSGIPAATVQVAHLQLAIARWTFGRRTHQDVPEELLDSLPAEDAYLVEAYLSAGADTLVTTDRGLYEALADSESISCWTRDEFLNGYQP